MKGMVVPLAILVLVLAACNDASRAAGNASGSKTASPSPVPSVSPTRYAVVATVPLNGTYSFSLIASNGRVVAGPRASARSHDYGGFPPAISTSHDRVYFLDGDSTVKSMSSDGNIGLAAQLPAGFEAHFAVSPDNSRIAVALLTYGNGQSGPAGYAGMDLYVSDLDGKNRVELFSSTTVAEWPIGWHGTKLVVAVSAPFLSDLPGRKPEPYGALDGFHVADSTNGNRLATVCPVTQGFVMGLATPAGVMCQVYSGNAYLADWTGNLTWLGVEGPEYTALEPGTRNFVRYDAYLGHSKYAFITFRQLDLPGEALGFIDTGYILVSTPQKRLTVYDVANQATIDVAGSVAYGYVAGRVPGDL